MDGKERMDGKDPMKDCSDSNIVLKLFTQRPVLDGLGKLKKSKPKQLQVDLKIDWNAKISKCSRKWTVPRIFWDWPQNLSHYWT